LAKSIVPRNKLEAVFAFMRTVCGESPKGAVYKEGWSDKRVAEEYTGHALSINNVIGIREDMFGKLAPEPKLVPQGVMERIIALERDNIKLQGRLFLMDDAMKKVEDLTMRVFTLEKEVKRLTEFATT
jgi:hypothetical protein